MKKRYLIGLLGATLLIGMAFGAWIYRYTLQIPMTMTLTGVYGLELLDSYGNKTESYDWGNFTKGQIKEMMDQGGGTYYRLNNTGNSQVKVWWNTSDPTVVGDYQNGGTPWELRIDESMVMGDTWDMNLPLDLDGGDYLELAIWLIEVSANGGTPYSFDLSFYAAELVD